MWEGLLKHDSDKVFLLDVVKNGLWIYEHGVPIPAFSLPNYFDATKFQSEIFNNLAPELAAGRVVQVNAVKYANAVGLVPKANSSEMRRITDLSRPKGHSINESIPDRKFRFQTLDTAMTLMTPQCFMAVVDIRHAY